MEKELRFFKLDFAKMVGDKEQTLAQLGNTQIALSEVKQEIEKKNLCDKTATNIHQVLRAKAKKERDLMKQERDNLMQDKIKILEDKDNLVLQNDVMKKDKKKLEYMIGDMFNHKEETKEKIKKIKEILDEF
ncbi:putative CBL-interacting protein kinase 13 [Hordeum vulgare]|nr:putative CBL-interacting protein kinase 13 [Hordeum vulgare]